MSIMVDGNYWPQEEAVPGFRKAMINYQKGVRLIGNALMEAFAVGLGLPSSFFVERTQKPMATLRLLHYPPQAKQDLSDLAKIGCTPFGRRQWMVSLLNPCEGNLCKRRSMALTKLFRFVCELCWLRKSKLKRSRELLTLLWSSGRSCRGPSSNFVL